MAVCESCGSTVAEHASFCPKCGKAIEVKKELPTKTEDSPAKATNIFGYIGIALAIVAIAMTASQPWADMRSGTEIAGMLGGALLGDDFSVQGTYSIFQFGDLGKTIEAYLSLAGYDKSQAVGGLFGMAGLVYVVGAALILYGSYRYAFHEGQSIGKIGAGCIIMGVLVKYMTSTLNGYSFIVTYPDSLNWSFWVLVAAVVALAASFAVQVAQNDED